MSTAFRTFLIGSVICLGGLGSNASTGSETPLSLPTNTKEGKHGLNFEKLLSQDWRKLAIGYRLLFSKVNAEELRELREHRNGGVAMQAMWEDVRRTIGKYGRLGGIRPPPESLSRFLGFAEGRLGVNVPRWWEEYLQAAEVHRKGAIAFRKDLSDLYDDVGLDLSGPKGTQLRKQNDSIVLKVGNHQAVVRGQAARTIFRPQGSSISATVTDDSCYIAWHSQLDTSYELYSVDSQTGAMCWKAAVRTSDATGGSGFPWHVVEIKARGDCVIVFGATASELYIEAFERATGKVAFRFNTLYVED